MILITLLFAYLSIVQAYTAPQPLTTRGKTCKICLRFPLPSLRSSPSTPILHTAKDSIHRLNNDNSVRSQLRILTGFSFTAFRTTMRLATGLSFTSMRATLRALTGISVTGTMKFILSIFPASFRYFLQPLLILYYVPLLFIQGLVGRTKTSRSDAKAAHDSLVQNWRDAVRVAEEVHKGGYWPIHVDDNGSFTAVFPPDPSTVTEKWDDINESIVESVELSLEAGNN